jgi:RNA polymerase sigma-70 factor (ECF subfamily)
MSPKSDKPSEKPSVTPPAEPLGAPSGATSGATPASSRRLQENPAPLYGENPALASLVRQMAEGRQEAMGALYEATSPLLNGVIRRFLERPEDSEEVLLDVYMKAWRTAASYSPERGTVQGWLVMMARSVAIDRLRSRQSQPQTQPFEGMASEPVSAKASPEIRAWETQRQGKVQALLDALPEEERKAVLLAFYGGLSHAELAEHLQAPLGTVKTRIRKALSRLRVVLEESGWKETAL